MVLVVILTSLFPFPIVLSGVVPASDALRWLGLSLVLSISEVKDPVLTLEGGHRIIREGVLLDFLSLFDAVGGVEDLLVVLPGVLLFLLFFNLLFVRLVELIKDLVATAIIGALWPGLSPVGGVPRVSQAPWYIGWGVLADSQFGGLLMQLGLGKLDCGDRGSQGGQQ